MQALTNKLVAARRRNIMSSAAATACLERQLQAAASADSSQCLPGGATHPGPRRTITLRRALFRISRPQLLLAAAAFMLEVVCCLLTPIAINELLKWVGRTDPPLSTGVGWVVCLGLAALVQYTAEGAFDVLTKEVGLTSRLAVCGVLYSRVLSLNLVELAHTQAGTSASSREEPASKTAADAAAAPAPTVRKSAAGGINSGELTNLLTVDAAHVFEFWHGALAVVLQPLEILGITALLALYVEWAALGGVAVVLGAMWISHTAGKAVDRHASRRSALADGRVRDTYEFLMGIKTAKMNGLEGRFCDAIAEARVQETALTRRAGRLLAIVNVNSSNSVDVISLAIVVLYAVAMARPFTADVVFTFWVLLGLLHARIFHFPASLKQMREGLAAMRRLEAFFVHAEEAKAAGGATAEATAHPDAADRRSLSESPTTATTLQQLVPAETNGSAAAPPLASSDLADTSLAVMQDGGYAWRRPRGAPAASASASQPAPPPLLDGVTLTLQTGTLTCVTGPVASAKSTLLLSLLGETWRVAGTRPGCSLKIGYAPQQPWIVAGTIRDNIVFGRTWDAARYHQVLHACALEHDLARLPLGDETSVSACVLSGGQRARIGLARAVYAPDEDLYLLDDVLSALDGRVSRHILVHCIHGLLASCTRAVVSSSALVLPTAHTVAVMVEAGNAAAKDVEGEEQQAMAPQAELEGDDEKEGTATHSFRTVTGSLRALLLAQGSPAAAFLQAILPPGFIDTFLAAGASASGSTDAAAIAALLAQQGSGSVDDASPASDDATPTPTAEKVEATAVVELQPAHEVATLSGEQAVVTTASVALSNNDTPPAAVAAPSKSLSFLHSWLIGAGGSWFACFIVIFLLMEAAAVEVGVWWLSVWANDPLAVKLSLTAYFFIYLVCVVVEVSSAYVRQLFYVVGVTRSCDDHHAILLHRIRYAPMRFFDANSVGSLLTLFGRDQSELDERTYYASEYFWVGSLYGLLILSVLVLVSPWVLLVSAVAAVALYAALREPAAATPSAAPAAPASDATVKPVDIPSRSAAEWLDAETEAKRDAAEHFTSSLEGLPIIRAFRSCDRFLEEHHALMDAHTTCWFGVTAGQSMQIYVATILGALYYIALVSLLLPLRLTKDSEPISPGNAGFLVVNSCFASSMANLVFEHRAGLRQLAHTRTRLIRAMAEMPQETGAPPAPLDMRSRGKPYPAEGASDGAGQRWLEAAYRGTIPKAPKAAKCCGRAATALEGAAQAPRLLVAPPAHPDPLIPPAGWPTAGLVVVEDLYMRYKADAPCALRGLSFTVPPGAKCGVIGRTGAGKSSVITALTRLVEPCGGRILIDGIDVSRVPLPILRSRIAVTSQDPLFFTASLRRNLDPFHEYSDAQLVGVLKAVKLYDWASAQAAHHHHHDGQQQQGVESVPPDEGTAVPVASPTLSDPALDVPIAERGSSLSLGQQQLLAIARALLRRPRVLLLDEVTAALEPAAEAVVLAAVAEAFPDTTVIQVAHRLVAVAGCDMVVVMGDGRVVEAGHPGELLEVAPESGALGASDGRGTFAAMVSSLAPAQAAAIRATAQTALAQRLLRPVQPSSGNSDPAVPEGPAVVPMTM